MITSSSDGLALIDSRRRGIEVRTFVDETDVVMTLLDSGSIADGIHGSNAHVEKLEEIERRIQEIRKGMELVKCPSCKGKDSTWCDACNGEGMITRREREEDFSAA